MKWKALSIVAAPFPFAVLLATPRDARALGPVDVETAAKVGYATQPGGSVPGAPDTLGFGLGVRAGASIFGIYGGANMVAYFGGSTTANGQSSSIHAIQAGGEIGYGIKLAFVTIRPQLGFGDLVFWGSNIYLGGSGANAPDSFYLEPGGVVEVTFGHFLAGLDAGCLITTHTDVVGLGPSVPGTAFTMHGQIGARF